MQLYLVSDLMARRVLKDEAAVYETITEVKPVHLGNQWPALHYSLCVEAPMPRHVALEKHLEWDDESLENALMGGDATPYKDGLTFARCIQPAAVRRLAAKLNAISPEQIWDDVDDGIDDYLPADWSRELKCSTVAAMFMRLVDVYVAASKADCGLLIYIP